MGALGKIAILTGAGISAESGLRTFRDSDGLWENHRVEDVAECLSRRVIDRICPTPDTHHSH